MERNRNKAGVTISDGCDGILYIGADRENIVTIDATVAREKGWLDGGGFGICAGGNIRCGTIAEQTAWNICSCATNISLAGCGTISLRQDAKPACGLHF